MIRRWVVHPQPDGEVSRDEVVAALMDGEAMLCRGGGVLTVITQREATPFPGEMVTTGVVFEWKDRTDARPQAETPAQPPAPPAASAPPEPVAVTPTPVPASGEPDGLDPESLEDEDVSAIPPSQR
jgi:hypothetical protein